MQRKFVVQVCRFIFIKTFSILAFVVFTRSFTAEFYRYEN